MAMTRSRLNNLAARCEKAQGPSHEIDRDIAATIGLHMPSPDPAGWPLRYTESVDAALTLRRNARDWDGTHYVEGKNMVHTEIIILSGGRAQVRLSETGREFHSWATTPALALCAAALRALASEGARD